jgi:cell division protein FtsL
MEHIITVFIFIATVVVGYFSVVREHENRIVRLETRIDNLTESINEIKSDIKELLRRDKT